MAGRLRSNWRLLANCADVGTFLRMKRWSAPKDGERPTLRFRGVPGPIHYRPESTDISTAWEVICSREYAVRGGRWPFRTVVDCGANGGMFLAFALKATGGQLTTYAGVEPDTDSFSLLSRQLESFGMNGRAKLFNAALWDMDGAVRFDDSGPSWARHVTSDGSGGKMVRAVTVDTVLEESGLDGCDLLKLDIEGGEDVVLRGAAVWAGRVDCVVAELHNGLDSDWFRSVLVPAGYKVFGPGELFRSHPSAVREDALRRLGLG